MLINFFIFELQTNISIVFVELINVFYSKVRVKSRKQKCFTNTGTYMISVVDLHREQEKNKS